MFVMLLVFMVPRMVMVMILMVVVSIVALISLMPLLLFLLFQVFLHLYHRLDPAPHLANRLRLRQTILSLLEMSYFPPSASECSPAEPRTWSCHWSATSCRASIPPRARRGSLMCTDALMAVPRFVGQNVSHPSLSSDVNDIRESMCSIPSISSWNTRPTSPPGAMDMMRRWSSSPTQTRNVFSSLWKMPRPVGQYLLAFAACKNLSPSLKRKWSSINCCWTSSDIPVSG